MNPVPVTHLVFAIPGDLATPTGGYAYDRRLIALLPEHGVRPELLRLADTYPNPGTADLADTARALAGVPADAVLMIDGLALGAMPLEVVASIRAPLVALVHHPLGYESGLDAALRTALIASERAVLAKASAVIATSRATADLLIAEFGVPADKLTVAEPGTDPRTPSTGSAAGEPLALLTVGAVVPRKGYDVLVEALSGLRDAQCTLDIVGALDRAPATVAALKGQIGHHGLNDRIRLRGALPDAELDSKWRAADAFVLSSLFEGYGMVLAEAMAYGLPIIASTGGAAAQTVPDNAALKVPPGDVMALRAALAELISNPGLRRTLATHSAEAGAALPRWDDTARHVAETIRRIARNHADAPPSGEMQ